MNTEHCGMLLHEFKTRGICHDSTKPNFQNVLDFQDVMGRSSVNDMLDYYQALGKPEKGVFLWAVCSYTDKETFLEIIRQVVCNEA